MNNFSVLLFRLRTWGARQLDTLTLAGLACDSALKDKETGTAKLVVDGVSIYGHSRIWPPGKPRPEPGRTWEPTPPPPHLAYPRSGHQDWPLQPWMTDPAKQVITPRQQAVIDAGRQRDAEDKAIADRAFEQITGADPGFADGVVTFDGEGVTTDNGYVEKEMDCG